MVIITIEKLGTNDFLVAIRLINPEVIFYQSPEEDRAQEYTEFYFPHQGVLIYHFTKDSVEEMKEEVGKTGVEFIQAECREIAEIGKEY